MSALRRALPAAAAVLCLLPAAARAGDVRRVESVGVVPIEPTGERSDAPRDAAVRAAVARAVEQVAEKILPEGWQAAASEGAEAPTAPGDPRDVDPQLAPALGSDPFDYASRFRILEDRGARKALFSQDPAVQQEYLVLVEVYVDAGRIRDRLQAAGWIQAPPGSDVVSQVRIVLEDLSSYSAYDALRRTLLDDRRVRSVLPVELESGRAVLEVESSYDAKALLDALMKQASDGLRVVPLDQDAQSLTLLVDWEPPPSASAAPDDQPAAAAAPQH